MESSDQSLFEKELHTSEIDNKSGFSNCKFSTFLSVIMKSLCMIRYLVVSILFPLICTQWPVDLSLIVKTWIEKPF